MRLLLAPIINLLLLLFALLGAPFRLLRRKKRPRYVRFRLRGDPAYRFKSDRTTKRLRQKLGAAGVLALDRFKDQLDAIAADPSVAGVVLEVEDLTLSPEKRAALVDRVLELRKGGKRVVGHAVTASSAEFEVLCACDEILMTPAGRLELTGFAAEATALGDALSRFGINPQFVRRGDYKTAPELFTHAKVSDIQRQTVEKLLDERYAELVERISKGRLLSPEEVRARIDRGPYSARRAKEAGLIDGLVSVADIQEHLGGEKKARLGTFAEYASTLLWPKLRWRSLKRPPRVAVIPISGMIVSGEGGAVPLGPRAAGDEGVVKALRTAKKSSAAAVVLLVNSPGGSALASEIILEEVKRVAKKKPVLAYFDRVAASGGYLVALGAKELWASPHSVVGSIGVFAGKFDLSGAMEKLGIHRTVITRGENAGIFSSARPFTPGERAALEQDVEETYQSFLEHVAASRGRTKEEIHQLAEGRVYSGNAAKAAGLVDALGGFEDACRHALTLAGKKSVARFEIQTISTRARPLGLLRFMQHASDARVYALWADALLSPELRGRDADDAVG